MVTVPGADEQAVRRIVTGKFNRSGDEREAGNTTFPHGRR
jgi:hypothetical protein